MSPYTLYPLTNTRAVSSPAGAASESSILAYKAVEAVEAAAKWIVRRYKRHVSIGELSRLSDHLLGDIGLSRHEIPTVVDAMLAASETGPLAAPRATAIRRAPQAELSVAQLSVAELSVAELPVAELPVAELPVAELPVADNDNDQRKFSAII